MQNKTTFWSMPPGPPLYIPFGLTFQSDGEVIFYPDSWKKSDEKWVYYGEVGKYLVTKDSLWLALPSDSAYSKKYSWSRRGKRSLILTGSNGPQRLNRFYPKIKNYQQIDSIRQFISDGWGYMEEKAVSSSGKRNGVNLFLENLSSSILSAPLPGKNLKNWNGDIIGLSLWN